MNQRSWIAGLLIVVLMPTLLLAPSLFGGKTFVPFDLAQFAPVATKLSADELAEARRDANYGPTEVVFTFVPELRFARQELEAGRLPLWNPYARFGAPLMATGVVGLLYPPNWLVLAHEDPQDGLALGALVSFVIAGGLMFGFLRALGLGFAACVFGALAFSLSGTLVAQAHFYQRMASLVWLPGLLWGVHGVTGAAGRARGRPAAGLAAAVGMTLLAGFPAYAAPVFLVAGLYALVRVAGAGERSEARPRLATTVWLGAAFVVGILLAAVQLLPMAAFFPESSRGGAPTPGGLAEQGLSPWALLLSLVMPSWIGHPLASGFEPARTAWAFWALPRIDWESGRPLLPVWNYIEGTVFVGTLTVPLAALSGLWPKRPAERAMALAAVVLVVLSGGHALLSWLHMAPGMQVVAPFRFLGPLCCVLAVLGACGLDRIGSESGSVRRRAIGLTLSALGLALLVAGFQVGAAGPEGTARFCAEAAVARFQAAMPELTVEQVLAAGGGEAARAAAHAHLEGSLLGAGFALLAASLWWSLARWAGRGPAGRAAGWRAAAAIGLALELGLLAAPLLSGRELPFSHDTEVHAFLRAERDRLAEDGGYAVIRATAAPADQKVLPTALGPCQLVPEHIRDANGYTFLDAHSHKLLERIYGEDHFIKGNVWPYALPDDERLQHPALDLLGIRWVLSEDELEHAGEEVGPEFQGTRLRPDGQPLAFHVYERPNALPRAFFVPELRVVADEEAVLDALASPDLDPRAVVYMTSADAADLTPVPPAAEPASRTVRFVRDEVHELVLEIGPGPAGHVVLNDAWFSGWTAAIDGQASPAVRANLAMRVVAIPESAIPLSIQFRYEPPRLSAGSALTALSWLLVLSAAIGLLRRR